MATRKLYGAKELVSMFKGIVKPIVDAWDSEPTAKAAAAKVGSWLGRMRDRVVGGLRKLADKIAPVKVTISVSVTIAPMSLDECEQIETTPVAAPKPKRVRKPAKPHCEAPKKPAKKTAVAKVAAERKPTTKKEKGK